MPPLLPTWFAHNPFGPPRTAERLAELKHEEYLPCHHAKFTFILEARDDSGTRAHNTNT